MVQALLYDYLKILKSTNEHTDKDTFYVPLYLYDEAVNSSFSM